MTEEMEFFIYLLEHYAEIKQRSSGEVLKEWDKRNITQEIYDGFFQYHQERLENAYDDIDCLTETGQHAILHPEYWGRNDRGTATSTVG